MTEREHLLWRLVDILRTRRAQFIPDQRDNPYSVAYALWPWLQLTQNPSKQVRTLYQEVAHLQVKDLDT